MKQSDEIWVRAEINSALSNSLQQFKAIASPAVGWHKFKSTVKEWSVTGAVITMTFAMLYQTVNRVTSEAKFEQRTEDRLSDIEVSLRNANAARIPATVLKQLATLDEKEFVKNLPALRIVTQQSVEAVAPTNETLAKVGQKLLKTNANAANYWPTVLSFIEFASAKYGSAAPPPGKISWSLSQTNTISDLSLIPNSGPANILLDGGTLRNVTIRDSRIIFTQHTVFMQNVHFINCVFQFPRVAQPTRDLQDTGRRLLEAGIQSVTLTGLS